MYYNLRKCIAVHVISYKVPTLHRYLKKKILFPLISLFGEFRVSYRVAPRTDKRLNICSRTLEQEESFPTTTVGGGWGGVGGGLCSIYLTSPVLLFSVSWLADARADLVNLRAEYSTALRSAEVTNVSLMRPLEHHVRAKCWKRYKIDGKDGDLLCFIPRTQLAPFAASRNLSVYCSPSKSGSSFHTYPLFFHPSLPRPPISSSHPFLPPSSHRTFFCF